MFDTICSISTPRGEGAIGIVRISGDKTFDILEKIFSPKNGNIKNLRNFSINYGNLKDDEHIIDEVLVSIMKNGKSYTKEDMAEINCHGGFLVTEKVLELVLKNGARLSQEGEFTRRAFINGRIDLTQAEAIIDLIRSKTEKNISISLNQLRGDLKENINNLKKMLLDVIAHVEVVLDYPEEGIDEPLPENLIQNIKNVISKIDSMIKTYDKGKKIKNGIKTAIIGKPNVGKSSLLNALLKEERAIVTHIPGTTRDVIEEIININGIPLILGDTAGIRDTEDIVENIGISKSKEHIQKSDIILFVIDNSEELTEEDIKIYEYIKEFKIIGILNKIDKEEKANISKLDSVKKWIRISASNKIGIENMEEEIYSYLVGEDVKSADDELIITNIRHKAVLEKTKIALLNVFNTIENGMPMDFISIDLREAINLLSEITGDITTEDILDHIFKNFCVGK